MESCALFGGLAAGAVFFIVIFILTAVFLTSIIKAVIFCLIFHKAGYKWALGLLTLIPLVSIIVIVVLAVADWPVQKQLRQLKQKTDVTI